MRRFLTWTVIGGLGVVCALALIRGESRSARFESELGRARTELSDLDAMVRENAALASSLAVGESAVQTQRHELANARAKRETLRAELDTERCAAVAAAKVETKQRLSAGAIAAVADCKDVGNATAEASFETALWAAAGGDVTRFAGLLDFDGAAARDAARALFDQLPPADRAKYHSPEELVAALTIPAVPIGSVRVQDWAVSDAEGATKTVTAVCVGTDGDGRQYRLNFRHSDSGWNLAVSEAAVAELTARLRGGGKPSE